MGMYLANIFLAVSISCGLYLLYTLLRFGHREKHLPPGPPTWPILGNAHLINPKTFHTKIKEWSDQYGKVFSLKIGADTFIFLNDRKAIHELLDKRSAIYSDRPFDHNVEACFGSENPAFMHATPLWRSERKIASHMLAPRALDDKVAPIQEAEICQLMYDLLQTPDDFFSHIKRSTASVASIVLFGFRGSKYESFWASAVYQAMDYINPAMATGAALPIEQFPILKYIPDSWAPSKARARNCYKGVTRVWNEALKKVEDRRAAGDLRDSLTDRIMSGTVKADIPMSNDELSNFLGALAQGAADTTMSAMLTIILHLAKNPWVQDKAQLELDRVCGAERMPVWEDFKDLPYINCIIKEGLRKFPVLPSGFPHRVARDDWYEGMLLPKNASIFFPAWAIHQSTYEEPEEFNPDRFLDRPRLAMDYAGSPDYENRDHYTYGVGRRICVGIHLAERTQWRMAARLLYAYRVEPALDEVTGKPIDLDTSWSAYSDGFITCPLPYKVRFVPRSEKHAEVIRRDFANAENFLKSWE